MKFWGKCCEILSGTTGTRSKKVVRNFRQQFAPPFSEVMDPLVTPIIDAWGFWCNLHKSEVWQSRIVLSRSQELKNGIAFPGSTGILPHSLPEWAFRARPGLWRICLCPKV